MAQPKSAEKNLFVVQNRVHLNISGLETLKANANAIATPENSTHSTLSRPSLNLDKSLHLTSETAPQALAAETAFLDEAAVLNNRLAHLEKQISVLQHRNATLEANKHLLMNNAMQAPVLLTNLKSDIFSWWRYLLGASIITSAYFAIAWGRRRRQIKQLDDTEEVWANAQAHSSNAPYFKASELGEDLFGL